MNNLIENKLWKTGSGKDISFSEAVHIIKNNIYSGGRIFIGSDSFVSNHRVFFATTLCLHGGTSSRYFFYKESKKSNKFKALITRITEEARRCVEVAEFITSSYNFHSEDIEIHLDVSPLSLNNGTSKYSEMLRGYVSGYGFECKLKPNAWASQTVADKHSK